MESVKSLLALLPIFFAQCDQVPGNVPTNSRYQKISFACKCHNSDCDFFTPDPCPKYGKAAVVSSSLSGKRFAQGPVLQFSNQFRPTNNNTVIQAYSGRWTKTTQKFLGFGGTLNDASAILISNLTEEAKTSLLSSYFDPSQGNAYKFIRTNIGSSQFSTEPYTYQELKNKDFSLSIYDTDYKIPLINQLVEAGLNPELIATLWSPPNWMKTTFLDNSGAVFSAPENLRAFSNYLIQYSHACKNCAMYFLRNIFSS